MPLVRLLVPLLVLAVAVGLLAGLIRSTTRTLFDTTRRFQAARLRQNLIELETALTGEEDPGSVRRQLGLVASGRPFEVIAIVDRAGRVLFASRGRYEGGAADALPGYQDASAASARKAPGPSLRFSDMGLRLTAYVPLQHPMRAGGRAERSLVLYGSADLSWEAHRLRWVSLDTGLRAASVMAAMVLVLWTLFSELVSRRLERVMSAMAALAGGRFDARSHVRGRDEIGSVGRAFDGMAARLEAEHQELVESQRRYQEVVEGTADLIVICDVRGNVTFVNRASREVLGREPEECIGKSVYEFLDPSRRAAWRDAMRRFLAGDDDREILQGHFMAADGTTRVLQSNLRRVHGVEGTVVRIETFARDVTPLLAAQTREEAARRRYMALFQGARDAIVLCTADEDPTVIEANSALEALLGLPRPAILGRRLGTLIPQDACASIRAGATAIRSSLAVAEGMAVPVEISGSAVDLPDDTTVLQVLIRDVRERLAIEERLLHAEKMSIVGQLAGGVAHDFNNQLTGILGYAELLLAHLPDGALQGYAQRIRTAAQRSADLTRQLLAFSRKDRQKREAVDVHALLGEVAAVLERSAAQQLRIRVELGASHPVVLGDASQLQSAFLNLGVNSRDAMPKGGELAFVTRDVPGEGGSPWLEVAVRDTGIGMDRRTLARAFEPFFTTKALGQGTGMGLAAVYGTVTTHGGSIDLASEEGRGTTCTMRFPVHAESANAARADDTRPAESTGASVLVVDDEAPVANLLGEFLRLEGYDAVSCTDGRAAIAASTSGRGISRSWIS